MPHIRSTSRPTGLLRVLLSLTLTLQAAFVALQPAHAADPPVPVAPAQPERVTSVEGITEYKLANGLRILLAPDASKPTTTVNMTYLVGSRHENYGETGMAHLLEHMMFKGTKNIRNALGEFSRRGLSANGSTSDDRTNYYASFSANEDTLAWYLGWQADAMVNSLIAKEDLDSEMTVVRNEMERGEDSPLRILMQKMGASAYEWHNYGKSTIGARSDVENVDISRLHAFYKQYYQPDNAVLVVSGAFDPDKTLAVIAKAFDPLPKPTRVLPRLYTVEPVQDGERAVTLRRHGGTPVTAAMYHIPAAGDPDYAALDIATSILGDTPSGRLYHALVAKNLASSVFGYAAAQFDPGYALFGARLEEGMDPAAAQAALTETVESLKDHPFTDEELKRAQANWLNDWQQGYADSEEVGVGLSEAIAAGDWRLYFLHRDEVRKLTLDAVQQAAQRYLIPSNRTAGTYIPTDKPVRAPASTPIEFSQLFKDYKGDAETATVAAFDSSPLNIQALTERETIKLKNGDVELALLSKPTRGDRVEAQLVVMSGDVDSLRNTRPAAGAIGPMLLRGTPTMTRQQIQDRFVALNATVAISGSPGALRVSMQTTQANLPELISTVLEIVQTANFPADQIEEFARQTRSGIQQSRTEPQALASLAISRHNNPWAKGDVRYVATYDELLADLATLSTDSLKKYRDTFIGNGKLQFAAVGQFDKKAVADALEKSLATWPKVQAYARIPDPYQEVAPKRFDIETPDKANAFYLSRQWFPLQDTSADYPALMLSNFLLGASEKSRLWVRVREKEGLSYSVRSQLRASAYEPQAAWTIYAIYAPSARARLEAAINEELARALKDGFTDEEVNEAKQAMLNYRALSRSQDGTVVSGWQEYMLQGRDFTWSADIDKKISALTTADVNTALRKYLKPAQFVQALAGDFAAGAAKADTQTDAQAPKAPALKASEPKVPAPATK